jgi:hypothetical protein
MTVSGKGIYLTYSYITYFEYVYILDAPLTNSGGKN